MDSSARRAKNLIRARRNLGWAILWRAWFVIAVLVVGGVLACSLISMAVGWSVLVLASTLTLGLIAFWCFVVDPLSEAVRCFADLGVSESNPLGTPETFRAVPLPVISPPPRTSLAS